MGYRNIRDPDLKKLEIEIERERRVNSLSNRDYYDKGKLGKIFVVLVVLGIIGIFLWLWYMKANGGG